MKRHILLVGLVSLSLLLCAVTSVVVAQESPGRKTWTFEQVKQLTPDEIRKLSLDQVKQLIKELTAKQLWELQIERKLTPEQREALNKFELRKMRGFEAVKDLEDMTPEERKAVMEARVQHLIQIIQDTTRDKGPWDDWVSPRSERLAYLDVETDPRFIPVLIKLLNDRHTDVRAEAAGLLGNIRVIPDKKKRAIAPLFTVLEKDPSPEVRLSAAVSLIAMGQAEARDGAVCKALVKIAKGVGQKDWRIQDTRASRNWLTWPEDVFMKEQSKQWRCTALSTLASLRNQLSESEIQELIEIGINDLLAKMDLKEEEDWYLGGTLLSALATFRDQLSNSQVQKLIAFGQDLMAIVKDNRPSVRKWARQTVEPVIRQLQEKQ